MGPGSRSIAAAYKDWLSQIGILATVAGLVSFLSRALDISLAEPVVAIVQLFRDFFHPILDGLLSPFRIRLTPELKDGVLVWMAIGGAVGRTVLALYHSNDKQKRFVSNTWIGNVVRFFFAGPVRRWLFVAASVVAWPVLVLFGLQHPIVAETQTEFTALRRQLSHPDVVIKCDLRMVLITQLATAVAAVAVVLAASEFLKA